MQTRGSRRLALVAVIGMLASGLSACANDASPEPTSTPTIATSPAASPTAAPTSKAPAPPQRPAEMATNDEAGALAAGRYFMGDLYTYMYATGDTTEWQLLSDESCIFCNNVLEDVAEMVAANSTEAGEPPSFEPGFSTTLSEGTRFTATMNAFQPPSRRMNRDGQITQEFAGGRYELHFAIAWDGDWSILAVDATPLDESS